MQTPKVRPPKLEVSVSAEEMERIDAAAAKVALRRATWAKQMIMLAVLCSEEEADG